MESHWERNRIINRHSHTFPTNVQSQPASPRILNRANSNASVTINFKTVSPHWITRGGTRRSLLPRPPLATTPWKTAVNLQFKKKSLSLSLPSSSSWRSLIFPVARARERESPRAVFSNFYDELPLLPLPIFVLASSATLHILLSISLPSGFLFFGGEREKGVRFNEIKLAFHF